METWKYFLVVFFVGYLAVAARGDAGIELQEEPQIAAQNSVFLQELDNLKQEVKSLGSKASNLELQIKEKDLELNNQESIIAEKEQLIEEKTKTITLLQNEAKVIQKNGAGDFEAEATKAYARVVELEKQVDKLEQSLKQQKDKQHSLESRASEAENKAKEFSLKYEKLEKVVTEQKARIQKAEKALQFAETSMFTAKREANVKAEELKKVHGAWLPPWLAVHLAKLQLSAKEHWANHGKPALDTVLEKASEKAASAYDWTKPHLETAKTHVLEWSPVVKKHWQQVMVTIAPHIETIKVQGIRGYEVSRNTVSPHLAKAQELLRPHVQTVKDVSGPYIDKVAAVAQPHIDKARVTLQPYTGQVSHAYQRFLIAATEYHHQLQGSVRQTLKKHELTAALATKELVWFLASALLALPVLGIYMVYSSLSSKKVQKPVRSSHTGNAHKRHKRRHVDK